MRISHKKKLLDILSTLNEAHVEASKHIRRTKREVALNILADCQETAEQIASFIEESEGEVPNAAEALGDYYRLLYEMSVELAESGNCAHISKLLDDQTGVIAKSIKEDVTTDKLEVVFLPYKASMWDCMESVWLAAMEDPECNAHVIPIPYYEKANKRLTHERYEGELFPDYVPVVHWSKYDIGQSQPDIVFIHNPYDECNLVTEVHRDYFSSRLKKSTSLLVYIPYFVNAAAAKGKYNEIFFLLPGVINADRVVVESGDVRKAYIRALKAYGKSKGGVSFGDLSKKIVALGSPKFDKVINSRVDDFIVPAEWERLLVAPDGGKKKVVLYNMRLTDMSAGIDKQIAKFEDVLGVFKAQSDIVLWFRPHPLNKSCLASMSPQYLETYESLIDVFREGGWGIYDETPDLHRAIAYSDVYYGDESSLLPMYKMAGKPAIIHDVNLLERDKKTAKVSRNLLANNLYEDGEYFWFTALSFNGLFKMSKDTWIPELIGCFPGENSFGWRLHTDITKFNNKLFFTPHSAECIAAYDIDIGDFIMIPIPPAKKHKSLLLKNNKNAKFVKTYMVGGLIYFIAWTYPGVLVYNPHNGGFDVIDDWLPKLNELIFDDALGYFRSGLIDEENGRLILACSNANALVEIDLRTRTSTVRELGFERTGYIDMIAVDDTYWLLDFHKAGLTRYYPAHEVKAYDISLEDVPENEIYQFQRVAHINGYLYLIPLNTDHMVKFDLNYETFSIVKSFSAQARAAIPEDWLLDIYYIYMLNEFSGGKIQLFTGKDNGKLVEFDPVSDDFREESIDIMNRIDILRLMDGLRGEDAVIQTGSDCVYHENQYTLPFINRAVEIAAQSLEKKIRDSEIIQKDSKAGSAIWEYCKNEVLS